MNDHAALFAISTIISALNGITLDDDGPTPGGSYGHRGGAPRPGDTACLGLLAFLPVWRAWPPDQRDRDRVGRGALDLTTPRAILPLGKSRLLQDAQEWRFGPRPLLSGQARDQRRLMTPWSHAHDVAKPTTKL